jgi:hypothetical protein
VIITKSNGTELIIDDVVDFASDGAFILITKADESTVGINRKAVGTVTVVFPKGKRLAYHDHTIDYSYNDNE